MNIESALYGGENVATKTLRHKEKPLVDFLFLGLWSWWRIRFRRTVSIEHRMEKNEEAA
jgi:hypothetical protein